MKIILSLLILSTSAFAAEWALVKNGVVTTVIVADYNTIMNREDGPWTRTYSKVGVGWKYDGITFTPPIVSTYTYTWK